MPDNSHQPQNTQSTGDPTVDRLRTRSFELIQLWNDHPVKRPILFGDRREPYLALDPYRMKTDDQPLRALQAFEGLCVQIDANLKEWASRRVTAYSSTTSARFTDSSRSALAMTELTAG